MPLVDEINALAARRDLDDDDKRKRLYDIKVNGLLGVINGHLIGRTIQRGGGSFCINKAWATEQPALALDVTFTRPPGEPVTHQIFITNPPLLPRNRTGNEKEDLLTAVGEMLEGVG